MVFTRGKLIAAAMLSTLGIVGGVGFGTYAMFTTATASDSNTITAGYIQLKAARDDGDTVPGPMFYTSTEPQVSNTVAQGAYPYDQPGNPGSTAVGGLAPGDSVTRALDLYNNGNISANVTHLQATVNTSYPGIPGTPAYDEFIQKMNVQVVYNGLSSVSLYDGPLSGLLNGWVAIPLVYMSANSAAANISFKVTLDRSADNLVMGKTFVFDFSFLAEQASHNSATSISTPFITPQDFNVKSGWNWSSGGYNYSGYSVGFALAQSPAADKVTGITVNIYDGTKLLQTNTAQAAMLNYTGTDLSTPVESDSNSTRYTDSYWTYGNWLGSAGEKPTEAVITVTDQAGNHYTVVENAQ